MHVMNGYLFFKHIAITYGIPQSLVLAPFFFKSLLVSTKNYADPTLKCLGETSYSGNTINLNNNSTFTPSVTITDITIDSF